MKRLLSLLVLILLVGCGDAAEDLLLPEGLNEAEDALAPGLITQASPNDWIVVFRPGVADPPGLARRLVNEAGGNLRFTYRHTIRGFAATLPPQAVEGIRRNPNVLRVSPDGIASAVTEEPAASWGLDRIDQRNLPLSETYSYNTDGAGVTAYILDTGIRTSHSEFGGRALRSAEADFIGGTGDDCHGHGTHVAGTVGGETYGVAKGVTLQAVRVLDCEGSGPISGVIAGVDWVTGRHLATGGPSVANMSLSAWDPIGWFQDLNDAVDRSVESGVVFAVAASNDNDEACDYVPASAPQALTVGATGSTDTRASFSNYGYCLDLFAPGVGITSAFNTGDDDTHVYSGTSMASPHVAGVAALYLGTNPTANHVLVKFHIITKATEGVVLDRGLGSPNLLLYSLITEDPTPPTDPPDAPSALSAAAVSPSQIDLVWTDNSNDEEGFDLERSGDGTNFGLHAQLGPNATGYSDTDLPSGTRFYYRVQARNAAGFSAFSNVDDATTEEEPPPTGDVVAEAWEPSTPTIIPSGGGKFLSAFSLVEVTEVENIINQLVGVTVVGDWYWSTGSSPIRSSTAVTEEFGLAVLETGKLKNLPGATLVFCVTGLSGAGYVDGTEYPKCSDPDFSPPDPGDPGTPGAPSGLTASYSSKGGGRVELSWTPGGGAEVDVFRGSSYFTTTADNGRYNDKSGTETSVYHVCVLGTNPTDVPSSCAGPATPGGDS